MMSNIRLIGKIAVLLTFCGYMIFYNSLGKSCAAQYLIIDKNLKTPIIKKIGVFFMEASQNCIDFIKSLLIVYYILKQPKNQWRDSNM